MRVSLKSKSSELAKVNSKAILQGYLAKKWWPEIKLDLDMPGIAADFYLFYAIKDGDVYLQEKFDEFARVVAKQVAVYLDAAIGGELRHGNFPGINHGGDRSLARGDWRNIRLAQGHVALWEARQNFQTAKWGGAFGGKLWGIIADTLYKHLSGELSTVLFVDQALALHHNTNIVFDKLNGYWNLQGFKEVLDANLHQQWSVLLNHCSDWAMEMFLNWVSAEEEIEVHGIEYSRPILVNSVSLAPPNVLTIGMYVRVNGRVHIREIRNKVCIITDITPKSQWVELRDMNDSKAIIYRVSRKSVTSVNKILEQSKPIEYIK